jgi:hypothetical protein
MDKKNSLALFSLLIILSFIGYIIYDSIKPVNNLANETGTNKNENIPSDKWRIIQEVFIKKGLKALAISVNGRIYLGGASFISCYDEEMKELWNLKFLKK